jgi:hypothetical protein
MKIQEALNRIKELKADAQKYYQEASLNKTRTVYLEIEDKYKEKQHTTQEQIEHAIECLSELHILKLAVQKANVNYGLVALIQEADLLKSLCTMFSEFKGIQQETDPALTFTYGKQGNATFQLQRTNYDTEKMNADFERWQKRIREINSTLQKANWEENIDTNDLDNKYVKMHL